MNTDILLTQMPHQNNTTGYSSMRESKEPQHPREGGDRGRPYHQDVTLPPISPYESYPQQSPGYSQDQTTYSESYQASTAPTYSPEYTRVNPQVAFGQAAPRQRTAIACRYCRRRKIRCSGFDQNPDGRCLNCQRFQQVCIFTPVSSQAQAFVPAHAVYPNMRNMGIGPDGRPRMLYQGTPLYGAHGQPLPPPVIHQSSPYEYPALSPTSPYSPYSADERGATQFTPDPSRAQIHHEPNAPTILPPIAGQQYSSPVEVRSDPMRLGSIMETRLDSEIDRNMLDRLGRKR
ncbi:putative c6 zinc finger domain-containing protein [Erysiphe neolycopersici]|uniref:Putative c6 zinc finger domain-containing protein n=1 Tax=Erysiphe neolycopersici TaxID=212602 RepID=A0A420H7U9_9PEZI|nr:putative c6 zinc finger domain-containing protein [Erysiphe neolycopersici]